ncbi:ferredoxin [Aquimarina sp. W85]|uniref:(2Fe-2S) ferredoxin domain-containing protein n=1 Tax=Aquimarina rhodophyticola TaxID=3342246 RepID=UPI00366F3BF5
MGKNIANTTHTFFFCDGGSCQKAGSEKVVREARAYLRNNELWDSTHTIKTRCNGRCEDAPTCIVHPGEYWYKELTPLKIAPIIKKHTMQSGPVETDLLYQKGWGKQQSNNEKAPIQPKDFELKIDKELGACLITKGFSSDQYLYPLFLFLKENPIGAHLCMSKNSPVAFEEIDTVVYTKTYTLELHTKKMCIPLIIGSVSKENKIIQRLKISTTEYFYQKGAHQTGIRFKNKFGETIGKIMFDATTTTGWKYCTKIQLKNARLDLSLL